jgi:NAD+ diphosphatase
MIQDISPHRFNNEFRFNLEPDDNDLIFFFKENLLLLKFINNEYSVPTRRELFRKTDIPRANFLFSFNEIPCYLVWDCMVPDDPVFVFKEISFFRIIKQNEIAWISIVACQLMNWYHQNRYCGNCGSPTHEKTEERALTCSKCGHTVFPKISPAIIVAIIKDDKILLANNANFRANWYSLVAGYADIGESLEETVIREVREEVGIEVKNLRYFKSQPWPISGSMMIGFFAEADDSQVIIVDEKEITEAKWFKRGCLPDHPPASISIAGEMIERFENNEL